MPTVAEIATRISWATRASAATRAGSMSSGSAVMSAARVELVDGGAGDAERQPGEHAADQHDEGEHAGEQDLGLGPRSSSTSRPQTPRTAPTTTGGITRVRPSPRPIRQTSADDQRARRRPRPAGSRSAGSSWANMTAAGDGVAAAHPGDGDRGLGLALRAGQHDRAGDQRDGDDARRRTAGERRSCWTQQGDGAERHQQAPRPPAPYDAPSRAPTA